MKKIKLIFTHSGKLKESGFNEMVLLADDELIDEINKYNCYSRLMMFVNENDRCIELFNAKDDEIDYTVDISELLDKQAKEYGFRFSTQEYIEHTKNDLDRYGNEIN